MKPDTTKSLKWMKGLTIYDELLITTFICIFAIVYKVAGMIAEENSLTI